MPQQVIKPYLSKNTKVMTQQHTDWVAVGNLLGRNSTVCKNKWGTLQASRMKQGPFAAEEDALIRHRVAEWGNKGKGLWVNLQTEMGRPAKVISGRWSKYLNQN